MYKKIILIFICLILLVSCGRKNDPKYEVSLNNNFKTLNGQNNFLTDKKNEIYQ